ncbi:hypothetical protein [Sphingomonas sp.]|uniref:hypothetical protein n=1 Tax=Sphingomonas sp. TaxID=28214 RepID=UPI002583E120|nr:hypothetical protein [Sphingomonas sp.]
MIGDDRALPPLRATCSRPIRLERACGYGQTSDMLGPVDRRIHGVPPESGHDRSAGEWQRSRKVQGDTLIKEVALREREKRSATPGR